MTEGRVGRRPDASAAVLLLLLLPLLLDQLQVFSGRHIPRLVIGRGCSRSPLI